MSGLCDDEDRSAAYMARYIAKNIVEEELADRCTVGIAYAIGKADPVAVTVDTHGTGEYSDLAITAAVEELFDLTPQGMIRALKLDTPIFAGVCNYGHFTDQSLPWEQTDKTRELRALCRMAESLLTAERKP